MAYCFRSLNTKERLLDAVRRVQLVETTDTAQGLLSEAAELNEASDQELPGIASITFQAGKLETDPIMQEVITGSGDSYLSAFIQQLGNSDWVKQALRYEVEAKTSAHYASSPCRRISMLKFVKFSIRPMSSALVCCNNSKADTETRRINSCEGARLRNISCKP